MRKPIFFLFVILFNIYLLPANNAFYLRPLSGNSYLLGHINGATRTSDALISERLSEIQIDNVFLLDNKPVLKCGDFDGDGVDEALVITRKNGEMILANFFEASPLDPNIDVDGYWKEKFFYSFDPSSYVYEGVSVFKKLRGCEVFGDMNNNGSDDVLFIFENADGQNIAEMIVDGKTLTVISYINILSRNNEGEFFNASLGDFGGEGRNFLSIIYKSGSSYSTKILDLMDSEVFFLPNKIINSRSWIVKKAELPFKTNTIEFLGNGFFVPAKSEQFCIVHKNNNRYNLSIVDPLTFKVITSEFSGSKVTHLIYGDFDGNGYEEPVIIESGKFIPFNISNNKILIERKISLTNNINSTIVGDFAGISKDEIWVFNNNKTIILNKKDNNWSSKNEPIKNAELIKLATTAGSTARYNAYAVDKYYKPLTITRNGSDRIFYLGWYDLGIIPQNAKYLVQNSPTNAMLSYVPTGDGLGQDLTKFNELKNIVTNRSNKYPKKIFVPLYFTTDINNAVTRYDFKSEWERDFKAIKQTWSPGVGGYYIGDDFYRKSSKMQMYSPDEFYNLYNYAIKNDNKYAFAADNTGELSELYTQKLFEPELFPDLIPMIENYNFYSEDQIRKKGNDNKNPDYQKVGNAAELGKLTAFLRKYNQPGFLFIAQAYGKEVIQKNPDWGYKSPSLEESWYDIFNSIVHGAGGLFYYCYQEADAYTRNNMELVTKEITEDPAFYNALTNGYVKDITVFSNKDGYNRDYTHHYAKDGFKTIGSLVNDVNYILRRDGNKLFLIVVNNSINNLSNVDFYFPSTITNKTVDQVEMQSNGSKKVIPSKLKIKTIKGREYKTISTNLAPYAIQIFKIK